LQFEPSRYYDPSCLALCEVGRFVEDCRSASTETDGHDAVREVMAKAVSDPNEVIEALGEPVEAGVHKLYQGTDITILHTIWAPLMSFPPHDHKMWAVIGIYTGREDNIFWRRVGDSVEAAGAASYSTRDAAPLGGDIVHSVINPIERLTGSLHIYGGDFFGAPRCEWEPENLTKRRADIKRTQPLFREANARYYAARPIN
jgi:predicted metal-dependent enzyme (double-stranded beta helix superfamily)